MYLEHYGLNEPPYSITPDPRFVFLSERHRDALAHLLYGVGQGGSGGFVQLTGEVGTGKTTLCRLLLEQLPENTRVALVLNPRLSPVELLETIGEELRLDLTGKRGSLKALVDTLNHFLLDAYAQGLRVVLIIDEAQNLSFEALEQVRLLTNLETPTQKLLQIILLGQPELRDMLGREDLRQLAQRITARYHLTPLSPGETEDYLRHRFAAAGGQRFPFTKLAIRRIHHHAAGVPRLINIIAERALLAGYAHELGKISEQWIDRAAKEALAPSLARLPKPRLKVVMFGVLTVALSALLLWPKPPPPPPLPQVKPELVAAVKPATTTKPALSIPYLDTDRFLIHALAAGSSPLPVWNRLLALWTVRSHEADASTAAACTPVIANGLYCLRGKARLDKLAALGRPAILKLSVEGRETWALLLGADAVRVRLWLGDAQFDTGRLVLENYWKGDYAVVWRAPDFLARPLAPGARGPAVDWIQSRLQPHDSQALDGPAQFDQTLLTAVRRLQSANGLVPDGVIGQETLLALSMADQGPRLRRVLD